MDLKDLLSAEPEAPFPERAPKAADKGKHGGGSESDDAAATEAKPVKRARHSAGGSEIPPPPKAVAEEKPAAVPSSTGPGSSHGTPTKNTLTISPFRDHPDPMDELLKVVSDFIYSNSQERRNPVEVSFVLLIV